MKRKAAEASLYWDLQDYIIRFDVVIRDPVYTSGQTQRFHLQLSHRDTIDNAKYLLSQQVWECNGRYLHPSTYRLEQLGTHLGFTQSVMTASTLAPIIVVHTDAQNRPICSSRPSVHRLHDLQHLLHSFPSVDLSALSSVSPVPDFSLRHASAQHHVVVFVELSVARPFAVLERESTVVSQSAVFK